MPSLEDMNKDNTPKFRVFMQLANSEESEELTISPLEYEEAQELIDNADALIEEYYRVDEFEDSDDKALVLKMFIGNLIFLGDMTDMLFLPEDYDREEERLEKEELEAEKAEAAKKQDDDPHSVEVGEIEFT